MGCIYIKLKLITMANIKSHYFIRFNSNLDSIHEAEDERDIAKEEKNEAEQLIAEIIGQDNMPNQNELYAMGTLAGAGFGNY